jgi:filamentous hemagglutinin family protein
MNQFLHRLKAIMAAIALPLAAVEMIAFSIRPATAEIIPDNTLPTNSIVLPGCTTCIINGGTVRGLTLFHSFREFSVPTGGSAQFNNSPSIQNILTRVTGNTPSTIDGLISANANLFLLNPNGIIFGPNAQLNIGGSFVASTANSIKLSNGGEFSATNPQEPPLLVINVPIGLQFGATPGKILNQSQVRDGSGNIVGLQVPNGNSLALLGGDVTLDGGFLTAAQGQIAVGSVANGVVQLEGRGSSITPNYAGVQTFQDIRLAKGATINATGLGGGSVTLQGNRVTLTEQATIVADTLGAINGGEIAIAAQRLNINSGSYIAAATVGSGRAGNITVQATDSVEITGAGFEDIERVYVLGTFTGTRTLFTRQNGIFGGTAGLGNAGDITINTRRLIMTEGGVLSTDTLLSPAKGGNVVINASESIWMSSSGISSVVIGPGNAGSVLLNTQRMTLTNGGYVSAATIFGSGTGGNIAIRASAFLDVLDTPATAILATSIAAPSFGGTGNAGSINIETGRLRLWNGGNVSAASGAINSGFFLDGGRGGSIAVRAQDIEIGGISANPTYNSRIGTEAFGSKAGGSLVIETQGLAVRDGGEISVLSLGAGNAGSLTIRASDAIDLSGTSPDGKTPSGLFASAGTRLFPTTGASGDLSITTKTLTVRDGAVIAVDSLSTAPAGNLTVNANTIRLDTQGTITAATASGEGGNITLNARDYVLLRRNSLISAEAGGTGNGGNISIQTGFVIADLLENSDIIANAFTGKGGRINITAQAVFGLKLQPKRTPTSDITASSEFGISGEVIVNTLNVDPNRGLVALADALVDSSNQISVSCNSNGGSAQKVGRFVMSGKGGLPTRPEDAFTGDRALAELIPVDGENREPDNKAANRHQDLDRHTLAPFQSSAAPIVEAQAIVIAIDGTVQLVAEAPTATPHAGWQPPFRCAAEAVNASQQK